ncbi:FlgD immunoglobulin-like domain containing protein [Coraliomargarita parva]|uniref:FlgD immunoglobulin-like domain containing protein n=1 Tax=Coraliomargarita parva TaxID=3014050 RepID=UPI0022B541BF|nr:FlgD immunoglobulin-like domain containing protein [Coraliomargarita parva]
MKSVPLCLAVSTILVSNAVFAVDFAQGEMLAVPVPESGAPTIDADLSDWTLTAQEPLYISAQTAELMNAEWAVMYDDEALYVSCVAAMPNRPFTNNNNPQDAYWSQDIAQIRFSSDASLKYPLDWNRDEESDRIVHASFWTNTQTGQPFIALQFGTKFKQGSSINPEGSAIAMDVASSDHYVLEAKIPWSAVNVPEGKNPFKVGETGVFTAESLWIGGDKSRSLVNYNKHPGTFAFRSPNTWGKLKYVAKAPAERLSPSMETIIADAKAELQVEPAKVGVPFTVEVPGDGLKVSVNIVDENGAVVREVIAAESHPKGPLTVYWDGRDAFMKSLPVGEYRWAAYFRKPIKAVYQGGVGSSGIPFYKTLDNKGGWGGDHSDPIDVTTDADHIYFLWSVAEAGQSLVKTDKDGKVVWRKDPFVGGGFGPFYSIAENDKYIFLSRSDSGVLADDDKVSVRLVRLLKDTGALTVWDPATRSDEIEVVVADNKLLPKETIASPIPKPSGKYSPLYTDGLARQPDGAGMAAEDEKVYVGSYGAGKIFVMDTESGEQLDVLDCPGVRGVSLAPNGDLYAVSFPEVGKGAVVKFAHAKGTSTTVINQNLEAPWDVSVHKDGSIYVSDLGKSQRVKVFNHKGQAVDAIGNEGGRLWQGAYDPEAISFLRPAGLAIDRDGSLLVTESSPPKVFSKIDLENGKLENRWYGPGVYWNGTWPMPDNPRNVFYQLVHAIGRADLGGEGKVGVPNAYWDLAEAGYEHVGNIEGAIPQPEVLYADNGKLYFVKDSKQHMIAVFEGDTMRPIALWEPQDRDDNGRHLPMDKRWVRAWIDENADGMEQDSEVHEWRKLADDDMIGGMTHSTAGLHMEPNGDLYFTTQSNRIVRVPATGFDDKGQIQWDLSKAHKAVPVVFPGQDKVFTTYRTGLLGTRLDSEGNIYVAFNHSLPGEGGKYDFADEATAKRMKEGMGHTSRFNVVKFAKFNPEGELIWMAGRKATAGAKPGEMYHHWNMAGIVGDEYIASGSEWGQIYFYTKDGFFVDALMNNPGDPSGPGPYTFGGETSGGRVAYFEDSGEVWAYSSGMAYKVEGFKDGRVENESRSYGTVELDKVYALAGADAVADPIQIVSLNGDHALASDAWKNVPVSSLTRNDEDLAEAQFVYNDEFLFARIQVVDATPLENGAIENKLAFKGGDSVGFVLGPKGERKDPELGDVRIMAASIQGEPRVIAMKAVSEQHKQPDVYETPAAGRWEFDFVGEVPGAKVGFEEVDGGYVATIAVPREFLEFDLESDELIGDVEVRLSGAGQRGLQAVSRNYLFTPSTSSTTMVDDVPTEARLYPEYWGEVQVK